MSNINIPIESFKIFYDNFKIIKKMVFISNCSMSSQLTEHSIFQSTNNIALKYLLSFANSYRNFIELYDIETFNQYHDNDFRINFVNNEESYVNEKTKILYFLKNIRFDTPMNTIGITFSIDNKDFCNINQLLKNIRQNADALADIVHNYEPQSFNQKNSWSNYPPISYKRKCL